MKQNTLPLSKTNLLDTQNNQAEFVQSIFELLTEQSSGHMERWEYGASEYTGDPAGGSQFWAEFIETTQAYYLLEGEKSLIADALAKGALTPLNNLRTVVELGPGSKDALNKKTLPFLSGCPNLTTYIAVDSEVSQAERATFQIQNQYPRLNTYFLEQSFDSLSLNIPRLGPTGMIMWGCTFGNISGHIGSNPYHHLQNAFRKLKGAIAVGDSLYISFDTEDCEKSILNAYNNSILSSCFLSPLHRLVRDGLVSGYFDPYQWRHESIWISETMQCAHTIYPLEQQDFVLCGKRISIPKGKRFITNNSYKFRPEIMASAAEDVGLVPKIHKHGPMALLAAQKR